MANGVGLGWAGVGADTEASVAPNGADGRRGCACLWRNCECFCGPPCAPRACARRAGASLVSRSRGGARAARSAHAQTSRRLVASVAPAERAGPFVGQSCFASAPDKSSRRPNRNARPPATRNTQHATRARPASKLGAPPKTGSSERASERESGTEKSPKESANESYRASQFRGPHPVSGTDRSRQAGAPRAASWQARKSARCATTNGKPQEQEASATRAGRAARSQPHCKERAPARQAAGTKSARPAARR